MNRTILFLASLPLMAATFTSVVTKPAFAGVLNSEPSRPMQLAQRIVCPEENPHQFVHAETDHFDVYICGRDLPHIYISIPNNGVGGITLPLDYARDYTFIAMNDDYRDSYRYVLSRHRLEVIRNGRTILSERATWTW
ncbi:MAG: hypothetical protein DSM106950_16845 [Stigonema ocellatum SAG 48.90 = DSM 106950]|nr:hypothetical protein [Stigonema ocellatum SAG 48.90 = DSM 106950]